MCHHDQSCSLVPRGRDHVLNASPKKCRWLLPREDGFPCADGTEFHPTCCCHVFYSLPQGILHGASRAVLGEDGSTMLCHVQLIHCSCLREVREVVPHCSVNSAGCFQITVQGLSAAVLEMNSSCCCTSVCTCPQAPAVNRRETESSWTI